MTQLARLNPIVLTLRVKSNDERGNVDDLLADSDVPLSDEHSSVVDRLSESGLEDLGLESSLHEVLGLEGKNVIQPHSGLVKHTDSHKSSDERVSLTTRNTSCGQLGPLPSRAMSSQKLELVRAPCLPPRAVPFLPPSRATSALPSPVPSCTPSYSPEDDCAHLEEPLGVLGLELEQLSGGSSDLGESKLDSPDLSLVPQSVLSGELRGEKEGETTGHGVSVVVLSEGAWPRSTERGEGEGVWTLSSASSRADSNGLRGTL